MTNMVKTGKWIAKHRVLIVLLGILLLIPSVIGTIKTRINYDILSYLPETLETVKGQDVMVDEFGTGAFSMVVVEDMPMKDVQKLKNQFEEIEHVKKVLWYDDIADISVPSSMMPKDLKNIFFAEDSTMMLVLFDNTTSSDEAMEAVTGMRAIVDKQCFISGMSGVVTDIKNLCLQELPIYVAIAALFSFIVLEITGTSFVVPILFLLCIGISILYNMGTNIFLGEISYLTQALVAILQLGVTMDYSIFLLDSFEENKKRFPGEKNRAMGHAISNTFKSIVSSSITTVAGFAALCLMTFALGKNLGIVMAKGVIIGVVCCVTLLPAIILIFDPLIEKTKHKPLIKNTNKLSAFIIKHYKIWLAIFCIGLLPAVYGNNHTKVYYNIDESLPASLDSNVANKKLKDTFNMSTMHIIMMDKNISNADKTTLMKDIEKVDGVKWAFGLNSVFGANVPASMIPKDVKEMLQSDGQELVFVCSEYSSATDESNSQIAKINDLVKKYDSDGMVIGEAPLMKDLQDVTDVDLVNVNVASVAAIFIIIMLVFKSISVPIILVAVIEFAINVNMAIPFFQGIELPFVASIVVGTIQLGATVDYAILMTSRYQKERRKGLGKKEAVMNAHKACALSIMTSGFSFFAATFGVAWYSKVDMIGAICTLLSRGALISMACVIFILPAMFIIFDKVICRTSIDFLGQKAKAKAAAKA